MGKLAAIKTKQTDSSIEDFINSLEDESKRDDSRVIIKLMQQATKEPPKMWGKSMIGFGLKRYTSPATGREVDWFKIGFAPRKSDLSLHMVTDISKQAGDLEKLGKHKTGKGCLYIKKLEDIDLTVLEKLIKASVKGK